MSIQKLADEQDLVSAYKEYQQLIQTFEHARLMVEGAVIKLKSQPNYETLASDDEKTSVDEYNTAAINAKVISKEQPIDSITGIVDK
jgi:hypothetical protein